MHELYGRVNQTESALKDGKVDKESKHTRKQKHANCILEYFECFCQMSSKSILIILSYTVSNLMP